MLYVCFACGGTDVMVREWINPNTNRMAPHGTSLLETAPIRDLPHDCRSYFVCNDRDSLKQKGFCFSRPDRGCYKSLVEIVLMNEENAKKLEKARELQLAAISLMKR